MAFYSFVGLLCLLATFVHGHPTQKEPQRRAVDLESFRLRGSGSYVSVPATQKRSLEHGKRATNLETALSFLKSTFPSTTFRLMPDHYVGSNGVEHFYFKQNANNIIDIDNADLNINVRLASITMFSKKMDLMACRLRKTVRSSPTDTRSIMALSPRQLSLNVILSVPSPH